MADRNPRFLESTRDLLARDGYRVQLARSLAAARRELKTFEPDIVLTGARLPGGDGYSLVQHVKEVFDPTIPCVLLFSREDRAAVTHCRKVGAENYLVRPLKRRELLTCVRSMALIRQLKGEMAAIAGRPGRAPAELREESSVREARTGFYTFAYFKEALYVEVKRARRYDYPLAVLLMSYDPPRLEEIKAAAPDQDAILDELYGGLALAVRRSLRDTDLPVSYGRQNILILMPHTSLEGAVAVGKRIRSVIKRSRIQAGGTTFTPTLSVGLSASRPSERMSFAGLIKASSAALRFALERGGNRIVY
ncbi:MAG: response regulator [Deltaproteobacteria bacterium]|nr:response regulator [Deltaproteobacteria bacterium]